MKSVRRSMQLFAYSGTLTCIRPPHDRLTPAPFQLTDGALWDKVQSRSTGPRSSPYAVEAPKVLHLVPCLYLLFFAGFLMLLASGQA
jgi:hypothetical protein